MADRYTRRKLATEAPVGYQRSRAADREIYGSRSIDGSAPLSSRSSVTFGKRLAPTDATGFTPDTSWNKFFKRPAPIVPGGGYSANSEMGKMFESGAGVGATDLSQAFRMAGSPPMGGPATMPMRSGLVGVTNPGAAVGTSSRIQGPNIAKKEMNPAEIARALRENRAAVSPGGMGTYSYTQAAQSSAPMVPFRGGRSQVAFPPTMPTATQYYEEGMKGLTPFVAGTSRPGTEILSKYGSGRVAPPAEVAQNKIMRTSGAATEEDPEFQEFLKRYRRA